MNPYIRTLVIQSINPEMWALTEDNLPKWFVNQATIIEVDIDSKKLVKLPKNMARYSKGSEQMSLDDLIHIA